MKTVGYKIISVNPTCAEVEKRKPEIQAASATQEIKKISAGKYKTRIVYATPWTAISINRLPNNIRKALEEE